MRQSCCVGQSRPTENKKNIKAPLAVIGTVAIDGIETPFGKRDRVFGGSASYFSYAASFFTPVALVAVVGRDFPDEYRRVLEERPIDLSHLDVVDGKTFFWRGEYMTDLNSAQTLETQLNALLACDPKLHFARQPDYLFLANIDPDLQMKVLDQLEPQRLKFAACDTMNFWIQNKRESLIKVLRRVDCFVLNDGEARQLTGETNLICAARKIREMGPGRVVIKKGEHGVLFFDSDRMLALPAYPLESVFDPTGAGDSFAGAMMGYLASTKDLSFNNFKRALAVATMVASFAVADFGLDSLRRTTRRDIADRLKLYKKISSF
jgi:sugar/nucleoside kinase (ribokinase family)